MAAINTGKVIVGGLVAGVVMFLGDMCVSLLLMKDEMDAMFKRLNLDMAAMQTPTAMASWVVSDLFFGMVLVWMYAAIRPRFGPGPRTALVAGFALFVAITIMMYGLTSMGIFTGAAFVKMSLCYLVVMVVASLAGGFLYKEDD